MDDKGSRGMRAGVRRTRWWCVKMFVFGHMPNVVRKELAISVHLKTMGFDWFTSSLERYYSLRRLVTKLNGCGPCTRADVEPKSLFITILVLI